MATENKNADDLNDQIEGVTDDQNEDLDDVPNDVEVDDSDNEPGAADFDYDEDDLRNLSDEERAAFLGEDGDDEGDEGEQGEEGDDGTPPQAAAEPEAPAKQAEPGVTEDDLKQAMAATQADKDAAFDKYNDGEMTEAEYKAEIARIDTESATKVFENARQIAAEREITERRMAFRDEAVSYLKEIPELASDAHLQAFDAKVRAITADPRFDKLSYRQILERAHKAYLDEQDVTIAVIPPLPGKKAPAPAKEKAAEPAQEPPKKKRPDPVPTLANIPAAAITEAADGKYAQLQKAIDNAGPEELERILGSMSEAEREAFASMDT